MASGPAASPDDNHKKEDMSSMEPGESDTTQPAALRGRDRQRVKGGATLSDELKDTLEDLIVSGVLKPGTRLDEAELSERFKVSRTPVREALKALAATGLVDLRSRQGGVCVARISLPMLIEMFQMMAVMEGLCAKFAARRATDAQKARMGALHDELTSILASGDHSRFYDVNQDFHDALYEASNTHYLAEQTRALRKRVRVYRRYVTFQPGRMTATIGEHGAILDAIRRNDPKSAFNAAIDHVSLLEDDIVDLIAALSEQDAGAS
jgi:DNA-binding GntR family transcriptional regulator